MTLDQSLPDDSPQERAHLTEIEQRIMADSDRQLMIEYIDTAYIMLEQTKDNLQDTRANKKQAEIAQFNGATHMQGYATTIDEYLEVVEKQAELTEGVVDATSLTIEHLDWLADPETQSSLAIAIQERLIEKKRTVIVTEVSQCHAQLSRIFPSRAEVVPPSGYSLPLPDVVSVRRWQRNKGIADRNDAEGRYSELVKQEKEYVEFQLIESQQLLTDYDGDGIDHDVVCQHTTDCVFFAAGIDPDWTNDADTPIADTQTGDPNVVLAEWVVEHDSTRRRALKRQYEAIISKNMKLVHRFKDLYETDRNVWLDDIITATVDSLAERYASDWRNEIKSMFEELIHDGLTDLASKLEQYTHVESERPTVKSRSQNRKTGQQAVRAATNTAEGNQLDNVPRREIGIQLPWQPLDIVTMVEFHKVDNQVVGFGRAVVESNDDLSSGLEQHPTHKDIIADKHTIALHRAVNGSWNQLGRLVNRDEDLLPWDVRKIPKMGREGLRCYYTVVPAEYFSELDGDRVDKVVLFLGACTKNTQNSFLRPMTGMTTRQLSQHGAGR